MIKREELTARIKVSQNNIEKGVRRASNGCPVWLAIKPLLNDKVVNHRVHAGSLEVFIKRPVYTVRLTIPLPIIAQGFIHGFDNLITNFPPPISFKLNHPKLADFLKPEYVERV